MRDSSWYNASAKIGKLIHSILVFHDIATRVESGHDYKLDYDEAYRIKNPPTLETYCTILAGLDHELNKDVIALNSKIQKAKELDRDDVLLEKVNLEYLPYLNQEEAEIVKVPYAQVDHLVRVTVGQEILEVNSYRELHESLWQQNKPMMLSIGIILYWIESHSEEIKKPEAAHTIASQREYNRNYQANRRAQLLSETGFGTHNSQVTQQINNYKTTLENINKLLTQKATLEKQLEEQYANQYTLGEQLDSLLGEKSTMSDKQYSQIQTLRSTK